VKRILVAGDTHGNIKHCAQLARKASELSCPAVFVVGDFGYWEHQPHGVEFCDSINELAQKHKQTWYFLDGNHDKTSLILSRYGAVRDEHGFVIVRSGLRYAPRGHRWLWEGVSFISLGGAYSIDKEYRLAQEQHDHQDIVEENKYRALAFQPAKDTNTSGTHWFPEEEMSDNDLDTILLGDSSPVDVMLTHDKPRDSNPGWNRKDLPQCWPNQDRIQRAMTTLQPNLLIHGHLHHHYTRLMRFGGGHSTLVRGLGSDPRGFQASTPGQSYQAADSWAELTLDAIRGPRITLG
jgi:hypothetical protein